MFLNLYGQEEIENLAGREPLLRLVEVSEESDREWGILAGYCYGDINSTSLEVPDGIWPSTFVNSNKETAVEVEKSMKGDSETAFTMLLKQNSFLYPQRRWQLGRDRGDRGEGRALRAERRV